MCSNAASFELSWPLAKKKAPLKQLLPQIAKIDIFKKISSLLKTHFEFYFHFSGLCSIVNVIL